jgi:hypothetical protein
MDHCNSNWNNFREISFLVDCICDKQERLRIYLSYANGEEMTYDELILVLAVAVVTCSEGFRINMRVIKNGLILL